MRLTKYKLEKQTSLLKEEMKIILQEIHNKIEVNKIEIADLKSGFIGLERAVRKNNVIIFGLDVKKENLLEKNAYEIEECLTREHCTK
ncbi:hypothetical protein JTB14_018458 [Gonioctena quinquepunctata]|nr:hypothetical protein JTB14_018458 [Gonioctena quinquepunctata]